MKLTAYGVTHPGRVRPNNEDALLWDVPAGLFVVADGMGGHQAGEVASKMAVETVQSFLEASKGDHDLTWPFGFDPALSMNANRLVTAVRLANRKVYQAGEDKPDLAGMGTTIVVALVDGSDAHVLRRRRQPDLHPRGQRASADHARRLVGRHRPGA